MGIFIRNFTTFSDKLSLYYEYPERDWPEMTDILDNEICIRLCCSGKPIWVKRFGVSRLYSRNSFDCPVEFMPNEKILATIGTKVICLDSVCGSLNDIYELPDGFVRSVKVIDKEKIAILFNESWNTTTKVALITSDGNIEWEKEAAYIPNDSFISLYVGDNLITLNTWSSYILQLDYSGKVKKEIYNIK